MKTFFLVCLFAVIFTTQALACGCGMGGKDAEVPAQPAAEETK